MEILAATCRSVGSASSTIQKRDLVGTWRAKGCVNRFLNPAMQCRDMLEIQSEMSGFECENWQFWHQPRKSVENALITILKHKLRG